MFCEHHLVRRADCHRLGKEQAFLRQDYSVRCDSPSWSAFLPVAIALLVLFALGFPVYLLYLLVRNRRTLQAPATRLHLGWMYARNHEGAEWWELFELMRKVILIGVLVLLTPESRAAVAVLISVVSCCVFNLYWPYRSRLVNLVVQGAYFLTCMKVRGA